MKINRTRRISAIILLFASMATVSVLAGDSSYSTADDPLVSLSYIEEVLKPQLIEQIREELRAEMGMSGTVDLTQVNEKLASLQAALDALGEKNSAQDEKIEQLLADITSLNNENATKDEKINQLLAEISRLDGENAEQNEKIEALENALDELLGDYGIVFLKSGEKIVANGLTQLIIAQGGASSYGDELIKNRPYILYASECVIEFSEDSCVLIRGEYGVEHN